LCIVDAWPFIYKNTTLFAKPIISIGSLGGVASSRDIVILYNNKIMIYAEILDPVKFMNNGDIKRLNIKKSLHI
jgi:hypothetical protein